jgi:hypothetical protein
MNQGAMFSRKENAVRAAKCAVVALALFMALSSCGPSDFEKEKLAFEKKKYEDEQAAKAEAARKEEADKEEQKQRWISCRMAAENEYNDEFKLWGKPVPGKPGIRSGPADQLQETKNRLQRKQEECARNFPKGISW